jgi:hypothetical protein
LIDLYSTEDVVVCGSSPTLDGVATAESHGSDDVVLSHFRERRAHKRVIRGRRRRFASGGIRQARPTETVSGVGVEVHIYNRLPRLPTRHECSQAHHKGGYDSR